MPYRVENIVRKGEIACYLALYRQKEILQNSSSLKKKKKKNWLWFFQKFQVSDPGPSWPSCLYCNCQTFGALVDQRHTFGYLFLRVSEWAKKCDIISCYSSLPQYLLNHQIFHIQ